MNMRSIPAALGASVVVAIATLVIVFRFLAGYSFFPLGMSASSIGFTGFTQSLTMCIALVLCVVYPVTLGRGRVLLSAAMALFICLGLAGLTISGYVGIPIIQSAVLAAAFGAAAFVLGEKELGPEPIVAAIAGVLAGCLVTFMFMASTHSRMERLPEDAFSPRQITQSEWLGWDAGTTKAWIVSVIRQEESHLSMTEGSPIYAAALPMSLAATYEDGAILVNKAMLYVARPSYDSVRSYEWQARSVSEPVPYEFQRGVGPNALAVGACHAASLELIYRAQDDESLWKGWTTGITKDLPQGPDYPQSEDKVYASTWNYGLSRYQSYIQQGFITDPAGTSWDGKYDPSQKNK
ncbi:MAG: hypothetical protein Q4D06_02585 [Coriobacteriia bacterium]|nr:hypothetical protein [Coriobacteriia bacterium]